MKRTVILSALLTICCAAVIDTAEEPTYSTSNTPTREPALEVLVRKCNVCHRKDNPSKVFTSENMDKLAPKIYRQVFVWKRMPKGKDNVLSEQDSKTLKNWLNDKLDKR